MSTLNEAAKAVLREALDAVDVHPCDVNDDAVRAKGLYGPMADLYAAAIAPAVAAGSVDTCALRKMALAATPGDQWRMNNDGGQFGLRVNSGYQGFFNHQRPNQKCTDEVFANVAYILAAKPSVVLALIERAEKAEAELAQVNDWRAAALASNQQMQELMAAKLATAEARVKEMEVKAVSRLPIKPEPHGIVGSGTNAKEGDRPCWTPDCGTF